VGSNGNAYVTGSAGGPFGPFQGPSNFPLVNPLQGSSASGGMFVTAIGTTGAPLTDGKTMGRV